MTQLRLKPSPAEPASHMGAVPEPADGSKSACSRSLQPTRSVCAHSHFCLPARREQRKGGRKKNEKKEHLEEQGEKCYLTKKLPFPFPFPILKYKSKLLVGRPLMKSCIHCKRKKRERERTNDSVRNQRARKNKQCLQVHSRNWKASYDCPLWSAGLGL